MGSNVETWNFSDEFCFLSELRYWAILGFCELLASSCLQVFLLLISFNVLPFSII